MCVLLLLLLFVCLFVVVVVVVVVCVWTGSMWQMLNEQRKYRQGSSSLCRGQEKAQKMRAGVINR